MRRLFIAAIAALAFVSATDASAMGGGGGTGKAPAVVADRSSPNLYDRSSPNLFDKQHAAVRHCKTGKPCPRK